MTTATTLPAPSSVNPQLESDRRLVLVLCYFAFAVLGLLDGMTGVAFALMRTEFNIGLDAFAWLLIPGTVGFLISSFFVGRLLNRSSMATLFVGAGLLRALAIVLFVMAPQYWMVSASTLLLGMAGGAMDAGLNTWFAIRYSPRLMNWLHASFAIGATAGPIILGAVLWMGFTWRAGFLALLLLQLVVVVVVFLTHSRWLIPPLPELAADPAPGDNAELATKADAAEVSVSQTLRLPAVWLGIAVFFFYTGVELTTANWSFTIFTEARGIAAAQATLWVSFFWGSFAAGRILFGFVSIRSLSVFIRSVLLAALAGALLLAAGTADWMALLGVIIIGVAVAPVFPMLVSETPARLGRAHAQHAIGFQVGAASLGIAVLPSIAGSIAEATSAATIPWFIVGVTVILIILHEVLVRLHVTTA